MAPQDAVVLEPGRKPLQVLHILGDLGYGGLQRVLLDLVSSVDRSAFESRVLLLNTAGPLAAELSEHARIEVLGDQSRLSMLRPAKLARAIATLQPDIVHSHSGVWYKTAIASRMAGITATVHTDHGRPHPDPLSSRLPDGLGALLTTTIVAVSEPLATQLRDSVLLRQRPITVIHNGIDTKRFSPAGRAVDVRDELGLPRDATVIGSVGRLEPVKGYDILLRSVAKLNEGSRKDFVLILVGDGSEHGNLETLASRLGITDKVRFTGSRGDTERIYPAFDIFVLSSRSEGTSISLLEAMSAGTCPIATDVGGNRYVLGESLADLLVSPEDVEGLADKIHDVTVRSEYRLARGRKARERARHEFSIQRMVERYQATYRSLAGGHPNGSGAV